jgi:hypothetical protein
MHRLTAAILFGVPLALAPGQCSVAPDTPGGSTGDGPGMRANCSVNVYAPERSNTMNGGSPIIIARAVADCDVAPTSSTVAIWLDRQVGLAWQPVRNNLGDPCTAIPRRGHPVTCRLVVACAEEGTYRTRGQHTGCCQGDGTDFGWVSEHKPEARIRCGGG